MTKAGKSRKEANMIVKKVILMVLLLAMVPFVMGPGGCLNFGGVWKFAGSGLGAGLGTAWVAPTQDVFNLFYDEQNENINAIVGAVNANAQYQSQVQQQARRLWGEDNP